MNQSNRSRQRWTYLFVVLLFFSAYAYFFPRWADWNQNSRLDVVLAIVDQGTLSIDAYHENTGDYALYQGHYYGEKAPGTSFLGVPIYGVFRLTLGRLLSETILPVLSANPAVEDTLSADGRGLISSSLYFATALYWVTLLTVALPSALLGGVFYHFLGFFTDRTAYRLLLTLAYGLGTIAFPYSGAYYGHQITAVLLFVAFWLLFRLQQRGAAAGIRPTILAAIGFLLGYSVITEYPTVFAAGALFFYAAYFLKDKLKAGWMIVGGLPPVLGLMLYNTAIFGKPWEFSYKYSELWVDYHHTGFFGTTLPSLRALWGITFSPYRGLFFRSPFLLLAIPGFILCLRGYKRYRAAAITSLFIVTSMTLFNASSKMWFGGHSVGPRYLIPVLPFLAWPIVFYLRRFGDSVWGRGVALLLSVVSVAFVWGETIAGQGFPRYSPNPLFDYAWPRLVAGDIARNVGTVLGLSRWYSLLPLLVWLVGLAALWRWGANRATFKGRRSGAVAGGGSHG